ncbi:hypothetical protein AAC387_Pa12g1370 [Persea americana]
MMEPKILFLVSLEKPGKEQTLGKGNESDLTGGPRHHGVTPLTTASGSGACDVGYTKNRFGNPVVSSICESRLPLVLMLRC